MPDLDHARALAERLMSALGRDLLGAPLTDLGWSFGFDRARRRLGACHPTGRRITLSAHLTRTLSAAEVEETLRHEVAHAIDVERRGETSHDATWRAIAIACGARPERCHTGTLPADPTAPYLASCPSCEAHHDLYRQPIHPRRCSACARAGRPAYVRIVHRRTGRVIWPGGATVGAYGGTAGVTATCPGCGTVHRRARRPSRRTACATCCGHHADGRFDARFRLVYRPPR
ncbi:SprT-like domain-containing protein [Rubrivirga marina]|uniref:SprT-like domain-containing protein n=1 Tax=Rubrivirga marina TaxID=1196024 RepID=A0A271IY75_9BACT|nr:SprT-like domain-containing protein [Rubrivirga marina]PAP76206.1 hypothetical protein BSZ37_06995 [Rubrivirga marina]